MERSSGAADEAARSLPNLLDGLNIEPRDRPFSFWNMDSSYQPAFQTPLVQNASTSPISSPSRSTSRCQARAPRKSQPGALDTLNIEAEPTTSTSQFDPPSLRSIFASGQPTSSLSVNTAQASMSTASPGSSTRPFAALTSAAVNRKRDSRPTEIISSSGIMPPNADYAILETEKDIDDPSAAHFNTASDTLGGSTAHALSSLFTSSAIGPLSRQTTDHRSASHVIKLSNDSSTLTGHLLQLGFEEGRHSDITIKAFGKEYRLHKLLLDRVPYFSTAFCGPWAESSATEMTLVPEDIDINITQTAFELAIRRIYGTVVPFREEQEATGLFATACWLDMPDLVESCIESILRQMHPSSLHVLIKLVTNSYYGKAGDRILSSAKAMLCRDGWEMPCEYWDHIPADIIREIVSGDPFYVPSEWERWFLTLKLLNRRLRKLAVEKGLVSSEGRFSRLPAARIRSAAVRPMSMTYPRRRGRIDSKEDQVWVSLYRHDEVVPLLNLLDCGIHYVHLRFEQLQLIRSQKDILGIPLLPDKVISDALWMSMELRQKVLNAHEGDLELGLAVNADTDDDDDNDEIEVDTSVARPRNGKGKQRDDSQTDSPTLSEAELCSIDANPRKFWIPNNDLSCVMGESREAYATATFVNPTESVAPLQRSAATPEVTDSAWAADLGSSLFDTSLSASRNFATHTTPRYSAYPPFRFCAEFPHPRSLRERKRVYSQTVWYAGSMWNLYIQRVNTTKSQQLGIYLHRAKGKESSDDPLGLTVDDRIGQFEREMFMRRGERRSRHTRSDTFASLSELDHEVSAGISSKSTPRPQKSSQSPTQLHSSAQAMVMSQSRSASGHHELMPLSDALLDPPPRPQVAVSTIPPYTDSRTTIKTYFKIYSPSKGGRLLSVYESAPDSFNFGKSWGWKTSWIVLDDGSDNKDFIKATSSMGAGDGKLRYMVVIGNI